MKLKLVLGVLLLIFTSNSSAFGNESPIQALLKKCFSKSRLKSAACVATAYAAAEAYCGRGMVEPAITCEALLKVGGKPTPGQSFVWKKHISEFPSELIPVPACETLRGRLLACINQHEPDFKPTLPFSSPQTP